MSGLIINKNNDQLESSLHAAIFNSLKLVCSTSTIISKWHFQFCEKETSILSNAQVDNEANTSQSLVKIQQSALMSTLLLKNVSKCTIMHMISIFFQYCSMKVFEPLNVYEKCKVFMCSMRCSDNLSELICLIRSLNDILNNVQTKKELRIILLKEHLSYILKITSSTAYMPASLYGNSDSENLASLNNLEQQPAVNSLAITSEESLHLIKSILDLLESMVNLLSDDESLKEHETLTIFIHILSMYLNDPSHEPIADVKLKRLYNELNDLVLNKLLNLGVKFKQEFKVVLEKWPNLKARIGAAFKSMNANSSTTQSPSSSQAQSSIYQQQKSQPNKPPKIQLKDFNFSKFK